MDKLDVILQKMESMEQKMDSMEQRMDSMEQKMDSMQTDIRHLKEESVKLNLRMDNEIVFGLKAVADGHADLEHLFINFLDDRNSRAQLSIRLAHLASEIHQINRRCTRCA